MNKTILLTTMVMVCQSLEAEPDSTLTLHDDDAPKLNQRFLKDLDRAFDFAPVEADLPQKKELTREQLHEWVDKGEADSTAYGKSNKFTREYFAYKCYLKEYCTLQEDTLSIRITGITDKPNFSQRSLSTGRWDFNHGLSMLFSKKYRRRAKSQRLAASHRAEMDLLYPIGEGETTRKADAGERSTWEAPDWLKGLTK